MSRIDTEKLLARVDLVTLAEHFGAELKRNGRDWRGVCPIHAGADNESSFRVTDDGRWNCFTHCNTGGNAIALVKAAENVDFLGAVKYLAEYTHISLADIGMTPEAVVALEKRKQRTDVLDLAARYFAEQLWSDAGQDCLRYARGRGFSDDMLRMAGWGFSPGDTGLRECLKSLDADMSLAYEIGLIRADGRDFTVNGDGDKISPEGWLIYSHRESSGAKPKACEECKTDTWHSHSTKECLKHEASYEHIKSVISLSARALNPKVEGGDKSRNMPGQRYLYKTEVPGMREIILCEGQADAESYRAMGFSAWALCGLGNIPENDLQRLKQRPVVYVGMDGDNAGQKQQNEIAANIGPLTMLIGQIEVVQNSESEEDEDEPVPQTFKDANAFYQADGRPEIITNLLRSGTPVIDTLFTVFKDATVHEAPILTADLLQMLKALPDALAPRYKKRAQRMLGMNGRELSKLMTGNEPENGHTRRLTDVKEGALHFLGEPLGNFAAQITHELTVEDGLNLPEVQYTIAGRLDTGQPLLTIDVPAVEFSKMEWIHRYWGARPILYLPRGKYYLVMRAMQENSLDDMVRDRVFTHTGWTKIDGKRGFLSAGGMITAEGFDDSIRVDLGNNNLQHYNLPEPPTGKDLDQAVKASLAFLELGPHSVTAPLWASLYAAPLTDIRPLYTVIWLYGPTQSGKSTVGHLALTHFGTGFVDGRQYHAPVDWMSTLTHIEGYMFKVKDTPIIIDDFAPQFQSAGDSKRMHKTAQNVVRSVGNRSARGRANQDLSERKTRIPRGMVISTAELPLSGESTVGRMLTIPIARGDVLPHPEEPPREALNLAQEQSMKGLYAQAMSAYIQWLAANWERAERMYREMIEESQSIARQQDIQNRLPDYYATLDAAQKIAMTAFYEMGAISANHAATLAEKNGAAILEVVKSQDEQIAKQSPVRKFFDALDNLLQRRKIYLEPRSNLALIPPPEADQVGWYEPDDPSVFYLDTSSCIIHVRDFWGQLGEYYDTTKDALQRQFSQVPGLLNELGKGGNVTVSKWVTSVGRTQRMVAFNQTKVEELYGVTIRNNIGPSIKEAIEEWEGQD
ncbi:MAG: DUF927 domain-containing protein [Chloroflexi bacterium]|nr:DUF927 domain-containing protein [Chloroflexota bacterium]